MLRWSPGFFGRIPPKARWGRLWRVQKRQIRGLGFFSPAYRWGTGVGFRLTNRSAPDWLDSILGLCTSIIQRFSRFTGRDYLHLVLLATAIYFFTGWFSGSQAEPGLPGNQRVTVWRTDIRRAVVMDLEEYLKGVVAAEMPANFHPEALKAQAVAARTYTLYILSTRKSVPGHPEADLVTDPNTDQAWLSESTLRKRWNFLDYYWRWRKVCRAVDDTHGLVLTYGGNPIMAAFHSHSGGVTEDSENYWSAKVPYLRSVHDPVPTQSPYTQTQAVFSTEAVLTAVRKVQAPLTQAVTTQPGNTTTGKAEVEVLSRFASGRVSIVRVGDKQMTGRALREALGLRSNWFDVREENEKIVFVVHGNGHGVGMSQFGADAYARQGATYDAILKHYYTGAQLTSRY